MLCENLFCIYWEKEQCILDHIELDILGCCKECIYISFDEDFLTHECRRALKRLEIEESSGLL